MKDERSRLASILWSVLSGLGAGMVALAAIAIAAKFIITRPGLDSTGIQHAASAVAMVALAAIAAATALRVGGPTALVAEVLALVGLFALVEVHASLVLQSCGLVGVLDCATISAQASMLGWQLAVGLAIGSIAGVFVPRVPARVQAPLAAAGALGVLLLPVTTRPLGLGTGSGSAEEAVARIALATTAGIAGALILSSHTQRAFAFAVAFALVLGGVWVSSDGPTLLAVAQGNALRVADAVAILLAAVVLVAGSIWRRG